MTIQPYECGIWLGFKIRKSTNNEIKELKKLGKTIARLRKERGLSLTNLVERGYPAYQHWQKVEEGRNITYLTLINVCKVLKLQPSELLRSIKIKL